MSHVSVAVECIREQGCHAQMDYAHTERTLRFASGSSNVINAAATVNQSHFPLRGMGEGGFASAKVPSANRRSGVTFRRNALPSFITGRGWPRLPGRSSRGCIGKLNPTHRLSLSLQVITLFPSSSERLQASSRQRRSPCSRAHFQIRG